MKKFLLLCATSLMLLLAGCSQFDASGIWDAIEDLTQRVEDLEEECQKINTNIEALQALVGAQQSGDTITSIAPIKQGDEIIGYTITFSQSEPITIYHGTDGKDGADGEDGADGKDGYTPTIGVAQDEDGIYYWTLDGEWLLDENGNKIKAVGTDGEDGANGENGTNGQDGKDGITPQLEIRDGYWYISYDNGATWKQLGKATGEDGKDGENGTDGTNGTNGKDGDSLFQSVTWDEEYAYFTLSDGTVIAIPLSSATETPEPTPDTYGLMGDFENNNWSTDIALVADGDYLVAQDVVFANANKEGFAFKVRKNASWDTSFGSNGGTFEIGAEIALNGTSNVLVNGEVGVKYDFYFTVEPMKIWVMADGETPNTTEEPEPEPTPDTYGLMGDFENNNWSTDIALVADGDYLVAQDVVFANANNEGLAFKVRKNASWEISYGTNGGTFELHSEIALGGGDQNIVINGEVGAKYDIYFTLEPMKIWVMTDGAKPGDALPEPEPEPSGAATIADVLATSGALAEGTFVEGVVISNMALGNLTSKKGLYIQDETAGLQFYLAANHEFEFGDKVKIDLSGVTIGAYNGAVQVSGVALDKITKISSGNTVEAKTVSIADFLANKYEGQYVAIEGVQVADADLTKTWVMDGKHTSINIEDANGNKFAVFSSKYATYGANTVAQGSGTIKGISSINNGNMQIIFGQESDFAGLTGTRFGATVEPEEPETPEEISVAEFLNKSVDANVWYKLTGTITNLASTLYGNFNLVDETGTIYVYGLTKTQVSSNDKSFSSIGLKEGDIVTLIGTRAEYNGSAQVGGPAYYVSHIEGEAPEVPENVATISFADVANRTSFSATQQVWEQNGITVTNDKGSSTNDVADYSGPARFYKNSNLTIEAEKEMTQIVVNTTGESKYYLNLNSGTGYTVEGSGTAKATITLTTPATSFTITGLANQVRCASIDVIYAE